VDALLPVKLEDLAKMNPKALKKEHRGFQLDHEPVWLGPRLMYRSVVSLFDSIRRLFCNYSTAKVIRPLEGSFGVAFAVGSNFLKLKLQNAFPVLAPRPRGRKRKRPISASPADDAHVIDEVLLEGITPARALAILCQWQGLPIQAATWQPLADQTQDFREWWAEERETQYPLIPPVQFQVQLRHARNGGFARY